MLIPMFVKYVLNLQLQQFFFHADIFVYVNLVHLLVLSVLYAAQILQIGFLLLHLDPFNRGLLH